MSATAANKIAITPRSLSEAGHSALSPLTEHGYELIYPAPGKTPSESDLIQAMPGCVGWLAGVEPISAKVIQQASDLKVISRNGVGVENIDMDAARSRDIVIERALGANTRGVAELAISLMLDCFRSVAQSDAHLREGDWKRKIGIEAEGRVMGIVGCGAIGRCVAELALGLGMKVIAYDPYPLDGYAPERFCFASLEEVFSESQVISFHCPPGEKALVNQQQVDNMRDGVYLINTARAELLDDDAVLAGLESGRIAALATDVFHQEPPKPSALLSHANVIQTPHAGGYTVESVEKATRQAVENILSVLEKV